MLPSRVCYSACIACRAGDTIRWGGRAGGRYAYQSYLRVNKQHTSLYPQQRSAITYTQYTGHTYTHNSAAKFIFTYTYKNNTTEIYNYIIIDNVNSVKEQHPHTFVSSLATTVPLSNTLICISTVQGLTLHWNTRITIFLRPTHKKQSHRVLSNCIVYSPIYISPPHLIETTPNWTCVANLKHRPICNRVFKIYKRDLGSENTRKPSIHKHTRFKKNAGRLFSRP